jgi:hypothetical protein
MAEPLERENQEGDFEVAPPGFSLASLRCF